MGLNIIRVDHARQHAWQQDGKQILKNVVINIPNDMWFERKAMVLALINPKIKHRIHVFKVRVKFYTLILEAFNFRYNI
jgi:hypothetical protein